MSLALPRRAIEHDDLLTLNISRIFIIMAYIASMVKRLMRQIEPKENAKGCFTIFTY